MLVRQPKASLGQRKRHDERHRVALTIRQSRQHGLTRRPSRAPTLIHMASDNSFPGSPSVSPAHAPPASPLLCSPPLSARHGLILSPWPPLLFRTPGFWAFCSSERAFSLRLRSHNSLQLPLLSCTTSLSPVAILSPFALISTFLSSVLGDSTL